MTFYKFAGSLLVNMPHLTFIVFVPRQFFALFLKNLSARRRATTILESDGNLNCRLIYEGKRFFDYLILGAPRCRILKYSFSFVNHLVFSLPAIENDANGLAACTHCRRYFSSHKYLV